MRYLSVFLLLFVLISGSAFSQVKTQRYNPFSGTLALSVEGGTTLANTDYSGLGIDYMGKFSLEYFFPAAISSGFGIRIFGNAGFLRGIDEAIAPAEFRTNISSIGLGGVFILSVNNDEFFPYFFAGISSLTFDPRGEGGIKLANNENGKYNRTEVNYNAEIGVHYPLTENLSASFDIGTQISPNSWLDDQAIGTGNDLFFTINAGITYSFLTEFDTDGDGIIDSKDMCPNTPAGIKVDEFGCATDSDKDGVPDYLDKCPGTPKGVQVNTDGCALDSDGDGVADYTDLCPGTPKGISVDEYGCPFDLDSDGVPNYLDKCPDTPYNVDVDKTGCPVDSDLDGVPDYLDQCPETPAGIQVDEKGCEKVLEVIPQEIIPEQKQEIKRDTLSNKNKNGLTLSSETSFEFNSAQLKPAAYPKLDSMIIDMKKDPVSRWRIEGYTDNIGPEEGNLQISKMRADSVMNFFISKGIAKVRFEVVGMGSKNPVADNSTPEGRAMNRRVEIKKIEK